MPLRQLDLNPEVQAVLDLCEIQGVPVRFENSMFVVEKGAIGKLVVARRPNEVFATQNIETVVRWVEEYKRWNPKT